MKDKFNFWVPFELEKSVDEKTGKEVMKFKGVASDDSEDLDKEILEPNGFEINDFLDYGFINYNHGAKNSPRAIVGEPTSAKIINNKFIVEGMLYNDSELAKDIYEVAQMLEKSGSKRRLGFSIEGTPLMRDPVNPKRIKKARISGLAITPVPKNKNTIFSLVKGEYNEAYIDYEFEKGENPNGGEIEFLVDFTDINKGVRVTMDKNLTIKIEKCITTGSTSGKAMIKESLEKKPKNLFEFEKALVTISKGHELGMISNKELLRVKNFLKNKRGSVVI